MSITKKLIIQGRVQGVGFRYSMCDQAREMGITGYVKNRQDGTVEAVVQGNDEQIEKILAWAKKGPSGARVDHVDISDATGAFHDFDIAHF